MVNDVLFSNSQNGLAEITLNQPKSINSLTYEMLVFVKEKLLECEKDPDIKVVLLTGAGDKGFCAGGDMKELYDAGKKGKGLEIGEQFFNLEYEVDQLVDEFSKPIIAYLDGVVMGGGVGLGYGAGYRIVTERTKWAMPEMNIGFFPDVGAAYFLNQAPGQIGRYLALTSTVINGNEALYIHAADYFMKSNTFNAFVDQLQNTTWRDNMIEEKLNQLITKYAIQPEQKMRIKDYQDEINEHFRFNSVEEIVASLQNERSKFSSETMATLHSKSPISLKVTLKQLIEGCGKSFAECLGTDLVIANRFMENPDFIEGVRSVLIDKDHNPNYKYKQLSDVSNELVNRLFK